ncbi:Asp-tRNA(Asn)/Glu-tRNA(Gln) amidotransferase subunit GatB [Candidatus Woesebacteria bacterium]|nr:Asp-tRNA(Asn)/Glu-tRNA(Gln) amidotransferase subunit GatB [Candidatus Woesebacteria bacterium]MCD8507585.1 Asp-tRNA(Asn)/Glu-tRNA(Gln) amidotransferase subunit GatB [Candidatus Woesebacteria bacterium]MCD8527427.1 Asp-tRNA(Asn)/Glu-tRNA(Gln) amidotransferase subunit GatB [Candidatus Woesebacteria bacterium]MCD8546171.1 Asp-tRNA(Asn)/Glu-tRNA(Gln) amidotransferase subunit GatB [Candidatus Woesebacteria bacterium]
MSTNEYTPIIGLEIHVEMRTNSKMFCGCPAEHFGAEPNSHTCPVCLGLPGALPVANGEAIKRTVKIGLALGCSIAEESKFDRKNYFYPDLPKGYQISQYDQPLCYEGLVHTDSGDVRITRVHLEEDTAKLQHVTLTPDQMKAANVEHADVSLLDFNRSGVPLVEIVTEPDIKTGAQAREFGKLLVQTLRYLGVSDCDMEKGSLRLEANISVQSEEEKAAGKLPNYKVEVKNLNSFRFLERAIDFEIERHTAMRRAGETPTQETRGWNDDRSVTFSQRSKEEAEDYRYFPDPDLPPLYLSQELVTEIGESLPELPQAAYIRLQSGYGLSAQNAEVFTAEREVLLAGEQLLQAAQKSELEPQTVANDVVNKKVETWILDAERVSSAPPEEVAAEVKKVLQTIAKARQTESIPAEEVHAIMDEIASTADGKDAIEKYRSGKVQVIGFLMGQLMRKLQKKVDAGEVKQVLENYLQND